MAGRPAQRLWHLQPCACQVMNGWTYSNESDGTTLKCTPGMRWVWVARRVGAGSPVQSDHQCASLPAPRGTDTPQITSRRCFSSQQPQTIVPRIFELRGSSLAGSGGA